MPFKSTRRKNKQHKEKTRKVKQKKTGGATPDATGTALGITESTTLSDLMNYTLSETNQDAYKQSIKTLISGVSGVSDVDVDKIKPVLDGDDLNELKNLNNMLLNYAIRIATNINFTLKIENILKNKDNLEALNGMVGNENAIVSVPVSSNADFAGLVTELTDRLQANSEFMDGFDDEEGVLGNIQPIQETRGAQDTLRTPVPRGNESGFGQRLYPRNLQRREQQRRKFYTGK